jgi:hypothetical protein
VKTIVKLERRILAVDNPLIHGVRELKSPAINANMSPKDWPKLVNGLLVVPSATGSPRKRKKEIKANPKRVIKKYQQ